MSLQRFLNSTPITILTASIDTDRYKNERVNWNGVQDEIATTGWLTQVASTEQLGARDLVAADLKLYLSPDETISAADRVRIDGHHYEVDGQPHVAVTPSGPHHIEVLLRRVRDR